MPHKTFISPEFVDSSDDDVPMVLDELEPDNHHKNTTSESDSDSKLSDDEDLVKTPVLQPTPPRSTRKKSKKCKLQLSYYDAENQ